MRGLALLSLLLLCGGCGGHAGAASRPRPTGPPGAEERAALPPGTDPPLVIRNASRDAVCFVHLSPAASEDWGADRLGPEEVIGPGAVRAWRLPPGEWDVLLRDCRRRHLLERRGLGVAGEGVLLIYH